MILYVNCWFVAAIYIFICSNLLKCWRMTDRNLFHFSGCFCHWKCCKIKGSWSKCSQACKYQSFSQKNRFNRHWWGCRSTWEENSKKTSLLKQDNWTPTSRQTVKGITIFKWIFMKLTWLVHINTHFFQIQSL